MKIAIVYDNEAMEGFREGWGFSCLVEAEKRILFDTGADGPNLLSNMEKMGIMPESIDAVVLSHSHGDHTGGLSGFLAKAGEVEVYACFPLNVPNFHLVKDMEEVCKGVKVRSMGIEEYLMVETGKGLLLVTGCSHPGLGNMIDDAGKFGKVYGALGGFHGFSELGKLEGLGFIAPCHCTAKKREILERFGNAEECAAGKVFEVGQ
jgi:7,8-dihydropterin-6-yl-methyl-4-(beta-D-ribofuranosyl)aminobenzene 5'-phosphate synthase